MKDNTKKNKLFVAAFVGMVVIISFSWIWMYHSVKAKDGVVTIEIGDGWEDAAIWIMEQAEQGNNVIAQSYGGVHLDRTKNATVVYILPEYMEEVEDYITQNATDGRFILLEGQYTEKENLKVADQISDHLLVLKNQRDAGTADDDILVLLDSYPRWSVKYNRITVYLDVEGKDEFEHVVMLFKKYIGDYPQCDYVVEPLVIYEQYPLLSETPLYNKKTCVEEITALLKQNYSESDNKTDSMAQNTETPLGWLQDTLDNNESAIASGYCGMYVDGFSYVVLILPDYMEKAKSEINEAGWSEYIRVEAGRVTYSDLDMFMQKLLCNIGDLLERMNKGELQGDELELMSHYPLPSLDEKEQKLIVRFAMTQGEDMEHLVCLFKEYIGDSVMVTYEPDYAFEIYSQYSTSIYPGGQLCTYDTNQGWLGMSLGYRAKYPYGGSLCEGFVTCGHGLPPYTTVYATTSATPNFVIGVVRGRMYYNQSKGDVSFVEITNSEYTVVNRCKYSNSTGTGGYGIPISGTIAQVPLDGRIYKGGFRTFLTSGIVTDANANAYFTTSSGGTILINCLTKATITSDHGDSGGIAYMIPLNSGGYGQVAGIVTGGSGTTCFFSKYGMIVTYFGAFSY